MKTLLEMKGIQKSFFGVRVLRDVSLDVRAGEVHALLGANGAGKSTLIKILSGAYRLDAGSVFLDGEQVDMGRHSPQTALERGIVTIYQSFHLLPHLSVAENICLSDMATGKGRRVDWGKMRDRARQALEAIGLEISTDSLVKNLTVSQQQMLEIAMSLSRNARVLIMDEPTAAISHKETEVLFHLVRKIKASGVGIIYISHRLEEIQQVADRVSVLRDGMNIGTLEVGDELDIGRVVEMIAGREVLSGRRARTASPGAAVMEVRGVRVPGFGGEVSFTVHAGEVLGLTGLVGAGKTELGRALFNADAVVSGEVTVSGRTVSGGTPESAIRAGLGYLPEDRDGAGLCPSMSVKDNITLTALAKSRRRVFSVRREASIAEKFRSTLSIKSTGVEQRVRYLSGGNKQKVIFAKWLEAGCQVLILDEPTIGIDVGAREDIYRLVGDFVAGGGGVLLISSDFEEVLALCDRIMVMARGGIQAIFHGSRATKQEIMSHCLEVGGDDSARVTDKALQSGATSACEAERDRENRHG